MHHFHYQDGELYCEEVLLSRIAADMGTPVYVYSERTLERHVRVFDDAFRSVPHLICYAVKANSNINILRRFAEWGTGFDIVSGGELFRVLRAGGSAEKVIFAGVGKTADEIRYALAGKKARISIRANPDVDPRTHPYISTGMQKHKFGVSLPEARDLYRNTRAFSNVEVVGVQCHLGSQITEMGPFQEALASLRQFVLELQSDGVALKYLDFGGGLGISYSTEEPPSPAVYGETVAKATKDLELTIVLEPGRVIVGNAGILLTRVLLKKNQGTKKFLVVDAGMNDLIRPALYGSHHQLWPVREQASQKMETADVVGPVCESADFFAKDRDVALLEPGELLAIMSAGAYGFSLSSNYNSRPRVAEVLVTGKTYQVIRRRETYEDLVRLEELPS
ncbi:MAG: diaminopimelate decarboxylase [Acidobacteria bacterium 13_1_20CM_2_55_15]|nr:MAG: diaminopimelate decarboxylase [Acidobacteria bacterium 13_1_20CM_2_55_15]